MMTDPTEAALAERYQQNARELLQYARLTSDDPTEQATALITAAAALIEVNIGRGLAPAALLALIEPHMLDWQRPASEALQ